MFEEAADAGYLVAAMVQVFGTEAWVKVNCYADSKNLQTILRAATLPQT